MTKHKIHAKIHIIDLSTDALEQLEKQYAKAYNFKYYPNTKDGFILVAVRPDFDDPRPLLALVSYEKFKTRKEAAETFKNKIQYRTDYDSWEIVDENVVALF